MTKRLLSTFRSNISYQQINAFHLLQAWLMTLMLVCAEAAKNSNLFCHNRPDGNFDFFNFVLQWPGSFCSRGCCFDASLPRPASQFTIHGLWPAHVGGTSPCFCKVPNYPGPNKIMSLELQQEMLANWVSMSCPIPKPEGLWQHEWVKHGSCSGMDQRTYFQTAIALHAKYDIHEVFNAEGIYPDGHMYDRLDLLSVLHYYIGAKPIITCSFNDHYQAYQIYEVFICLDKWNLLPIPCPDAATYHTNCRTPYVLFPEFRPLPPRSPPVRYCTDPNSLACDGLNPSDEENLESYLDAVDSELDGGCIPKTKKLDQELDFF